MNKKIILKFNSLFIVLVLFVFGCIIFTGGFFNNKTPQFSVPVLSSVTNEEASDANGDDSASDDSTTTAVVSDEASAVSGSGEDSVANLGGWIESDPIVSPKEFTKTVGGYGFIIKLGADDDADKYRLFLLIDVEDELEETQLTTEFETDYGLINGLIIDEIKRRIVFSETDSENNEINPFSWKHSSDTSNTTVYKTKFENYEFILTLSIAIDDNFGKIKLLASNENSDNEVYLLESEIVTFVDATRSEIDRAVLIWIVVKTVDEFRSAYGTYRSVSLIQSLYKYNFFEIVSGLLYTIAGIIMGTVGVIYWWNNIKKQKLLSAISSTNKKKNKSKSKNKKK